MCGNRVQHQKEYALTKLLYNWRQLEPYKHNSSAENVGYNCAVKKSYTTFHGAEISEILELWLLQDFIIYSLQGISDIRGKHVLF